MRSFLIVVLFAASAFAQNQQPPAPAAPAPAPAKGAASQDPAAQPANDNAVLAEAGDYKLTESEFNTIVRLLGPQARNAQKQELIRRWMMVVVFAQEAESSGADKDPDFLREMELFKKQSLFSRYQRNLVSDVPRATPEEAQKFFDENPKQFQRPGSARVSRILVPTQEKANQASQELRSGKSFEEVAKSHSIDGASKDKGGDLGWVNAGATEPAFDQAVFSTDLNQVSEPFETKLGWQIVKVAEKKEPVKIEFAQVQDRLIQQLTLKKQQDVVEAKAAELFKKHNVKIQGQSQGDNK